MKIHKNVFRALLCQCSVRPPTLFVTAVAPGLVPASCILPSPGSSVVSERFGVQGTAALMLPVQNGGAPTGKQTSKKKNQPKQPLFFFFQFGSLENYYHFHHSKTFKRSTLSSRGPHNFLRMDPKVRGWAPWGPPPVLGGGCWLDLGQV